MKSMQNPFYLEDDAGATQTQGWLQAWNTSVSPYAVAAQSAEDVATAVTFARENNLRLVIKGTGHDYLGRSNAPDSLLIWTHQLRDIQYVKNFAIEGGDNSTVPALTFGAGTRWLEAYKAATDVGMYVQGGGCTSVGASGGFIQGSGFGSFSKMFGTGAGGVLQFEVVTADGEIRIANAAQNSDLFWALRGGGGGTFGVVTKTTLLAHPIPRTMGVLGGSIKASDDQAFKSLLVQLSAFIPALVNPSWGESINIEDNNQVQLGMVFLNLSEREARQTWRPLLDWVDNQGSKVTADLTFKSLPFRDQWNAAYWDKTDPAFITHDPRSGTPEWRYWWSSNQAEVSWYIAEYQSRWLPTSLLAQTEKFAELMFQASRKNGFTVQLNKGLAGESAEARARDEQTAINPVAFDAAALIIAASGDQNIYPGVNGFEPNEVTLAAARDKVNQCIDVFRPDCHGAYANEASYFESDWQEQFWGSNYSKLLDIKRKYDPTNLFRVHHGVGSE